MFKKIVIVVAVLIGLLFMYAAIQPSEYKISRRLLIHAQPEVLFSYINNSKKMNEWMPWAEEDPQVQMSYSGPDEGIGSISSWDSAGTMGTGKSTIIESIANSSTKTRIDYFKPMEMIQMSDMLLTPQAEGTMVSWAVTGQNGFMNRVFCVFMNMDKYIGGKFEKGLSKLKNLVEK